MSTSLRDDDAKRWHMSICPYCGVGCGVEIGVERGAVTEVRGMADHPVNKGQLCGLGNNLVDILSTDDRLLHPQLKKQSRKDGALTRVSWDEATSTVASRLQQIVSRHGPDAFAMYVSASEHLEEYYIYNKFVKGCLGTNNLESSARLCWASGVAGLVSAFGADAPPCAYDDIELAELFVVAGYNPAASKPVFFQRLLRAKASGGVPLIVIDPRRTESSVSADLHLRLAPGTDVALFNAIAHVLIEEGLIDEPQARALCDDFDGLREHVRDCTPAYVASVTGLSTDAIVEAARMIGGANTAMFMWGQGLNQSTIGTRKVSALLNLVFITGNVGKPGAGPMAVTGQSGAMALREVGALPHLLPGFRSVSDPQARADIAAIWGVSPDAISPKVGLTLPRILEGIDEGRIKALWVIHSNPAATFPDSNWVRAALDKCELLIVQDCYHPTETTRHADVLLPAAQWAEKAGTVTNSERGLNLVEQAVEPPGEARADLDIVCAVARKMGYGAQFSYQGVEAIFEEYKRCAEGRACDIGGVSYARLKKDKGIQWPVPSSSHPGTKRRFVDGTLPQGKVHLGLHHHQPQAERPDADYPLLLNTGLVAAQFHSRTRTAKVPALARALPELRIDVHPGDAIRYGVSDGDSARLSSRRGSIEARVSVTDATPAGSVFVPYHFGGLTGAQQAVNALTNRAFDEHAEQPEYKACAVSICKLEPASSGR
jgi:anaerobic selenocysteine-containing dehydrogenase